MTRSSFARRQVFRSFQHVCRRRRAAAHRAALLTDPARHTRNTRRGLTRPVDAVVSPNGAQVVAFLDCFAAVRFGSRGGVGARQRCLPLFQRNHRAVHAADRVAANHLRRLSLVDRCGRFQHRPVLR